MGLPPSVDDLRLVDAVARHGSLGAAARELLVSQPAASQRLAALERRIGVRLFDRDTTGARATPAGRELADQASHVLAHLDSLVERTLAAARSRTLSVGTIHSLAGVVFAALDAELGDLVVQPDVDHGPVLMERVADGTLDAALVTIAGQTTLPPGVVATELGSHRLVVLLPDGVAGSGRGARPWAGRTIVYSTLDRSGDTLHRRLAELGAQPRPGATAEATVRMARARRCPAVVPDVVARWYAGPGDRTDKAPSSSRTVLSLVTRSPAPADLLAALPRLRHRIATAG